MESLDDVGLLSRVANGQKDAMRLLYERHHDALFAFLRTRGIDPTTVEDILHDTMLAVWRSAGRYQGSASVRSWIFSIARNKQVDHFRKSVRLSVVEDVPETVDDSPDAASVIEASQDAVQVRTCLAKLKDVQRIAIHLAFFENLTYDQIAEIEAVPPGTIKSRIFHGKQALMHCLSRRDSVTAAKK